MRRRRRGGRGEEGGGGCYDCAPGGDGDGPEVEVVPDGVLEVVVHAALGEARVQVLAQVGGDRACNIGVRHSL